MKLDDFHIRSFPMSEDPHARVVDITFTVGLDLEEDPVLAVQHLIQGINNLVHHVAVDEIGLEEDEDLSYVAQEEEEGEEEGEEHDDGEEGAGENDAIGYVHAEDSDQEDDPEPQASGKRRTKAEMEEWRAWKARQDAKAEVQGSADAEDGEEPEPEPEARRDSAGEPRRRRAGTPGGAPVGGTGEPVGRRRNVSSDDNGQRGDASADESGGGGGSAPRRRRSPAGSGTAAATEAEAPEPELSSAYLIKLAVEAVNVSSADQVMSIVGSFGVKNISDLSAADRPKLAFQLRAIIEGANG